MASYAWQRIIALSSLLAGLHAINQILEAFDDFAIRSPLLQNIVCRKERGGGFPDMTEILDDFDRSFDRAKAAQGQFEIREGIDGEFDLATHGIGDSIRQLDLYKIEMCVRWDLPDSSWKYINTKPDNQVKYIIELPSNVLCPEGLAFTGARGTGAKCVHHYHSWYFDEIVHDLNYWYALQHDRKAVGMRLFFRKFDSYRSLWEAAGYSMAQLDALISLAKASMADGYNRAFILDCLGNNGSTINMTQGHHPMVEKVFDRKSFVPNNIALDKHRMMLLSGANMGGKSTLLRQVCLLTIMAQIGCFVPADVFKLIPVDKIYTRIGASDRILTGRSTLSVELDETDTALKGEPPHAVW